MATKVAMMQINSEFSGQWYLPYASGLLESYAKKHLPYPERYEFATPIFRREKVADIVGKLKESDLLGTTLYSWNEQLSLQSIEKLKREKPSILAVCGGPQVPRAERPWEIEAFHRKYPFIDLLVHGAGEKPFLEILKSGLGGNWETLPSVSFVKSGGEFVKTAQAADLKDLDETPDPFLTGVF
ncbi:MAG: hypothetical protein Q7S28_01325, partial [bacterium]|nr:hypothetical protein [bacterium]